MSTYFEAVNDNGKVVIDDNFARIHCRETLRLSDCSFLQVTTTGCDYDIGADYKLGLAFTFSLPLTTNDVFIAFKPTGVAVNDNIGVVSDLLSTGEARLALITGVNSGVTTSNYLTYAHDVIVYIFSKGNFPQATFGLECYDESGNVVFNSNTKLLNVVSHYTRVCTYPDWITSYPLRYTIGVSANLACIMNSHVGHQASPGVMSSMGAMCYTLSTQNGQYVERYFVRGNWWPQTEGICWAGMPYQVWLSSYGNLLNDWLFIDASNIPLPN